MRPQGLKKKLKTDHILHRAVCRMEGDLNVLLGYRRFFRNMHSLSHVVVTYVSGGDFAVWSNQYLSFFVERFTLYCSGIYDTINFGSASFGK